MKTSKEVLSSMLKTTQMGQLGIRSCLKEVMDPGLRQALESQLREYDAIETEAHSLANRRGWEVEELDPGIRVMTDAMTRARVRRGDSDSKIADMMIQGNTKGMIKGLKNLHALPCSDAPLELLAQKLLDCETANIRQMQPFL